MDLKNRVCVVTGAAKGIGLAVAQELIHAGARVALCDADREALQEACSILPESQAMAIKADVRREQDMKQLTNEVEKNWGELAIWINNAGLARHKLIADTQEEDIDLVMDVNLKGTILGSKYALLKMQPQRNGHIVNIISTAGITGIPGQSVYCATKFAVRGFSQALTEEAASYGIRVTSIFPGGVDTAFWAQQGRKPPKEMLLSPVHIAKGVISVLKMDDVCVARELVLRSITDVDLLPPGPLVNSE